MPLADEDDGPAVACALGCGGEWIRWVGCMCVFVMRVCLYIALILLFHRIVACNASHASSNNRLHRFGIAVSSLEPCRVPPTVPRCEQRFVPCVRRRSGTWKPLRRRARGHERSAAPKYSIDAWAAPLLCGGVWRSAHCGPAGPGLCVGTRPAPVGQRLVIRCAPPHGQLGPRARVELSQQLPLQVGRRGRVGRGRARRVRVCRSAGGQRSAAAGAWMWSPSAETTRAAEETGRIEIGACSLLCCPSFFWSLASHLHTCICLWQAAAFPRRSGESVAQTGCEINKSEV